MSEQLYKQWDNIWQKRWKSEKKDGNHFISRAVFRAKKENLRKILEVIKPKNAIDVGCGLGFTLSVFKEMGINALGVDVSAKAVEICRGQKLNAEQKRLEDIGEKYDLVFADGLLEHFINFEPYAKKLMAISDNYVLLIQTDHENFWGKTLNYLTEVFSGDKNILEYNYKINDFIAVFENNGFKLVKTADFCRGTFKLLLLKKSC